MDAADIPSLPAPATASMGSTLPARATPPGESLQHRRNSITQAHRFAPTRTGHRGVKASPVRTTGRFKERHRNGRRCARDDAKPGHRAGNRRRGAAARRHRFVAPPDAAGWRESLDPVLAALEWLAHGVRASDRGVREAAFWVAGRLCAPLLGSRAMRHWYLGPLSARRARSG